MTTLTPAPSDLAVQISHWVSFYSLITGIAATLVGLLFVAVSLHLDAFTQKRENDARLAAEQTLTNFSTLLVIGLVFNIPGVDAPGLGLTFVLLGAGILIRVGSIVIRYVRQDWLSHGKPHPALGRAYLSFVTRRIVYPALTYGILVVSGQQLLQASTQGLILLAVVAFFLIVGSLLNTWSLLIDLSRYNLHQNQSSQSSP